jgi:hypothetical protein
VGYRYQRPGDMKTGLIEDAVKRGLPCLVCMKTGLPTCKECHAILLMDFGETSYQYFDTNTPGLTYTGSRAWWDENFTGLVIVLDCKGQNE